MVCPIGGALSPWLWLLDINSHPARVSHVRLECSEEVASGTGCDPLADDVACVLAHGDAAVAAPCGVENGGDFRTGTGQAGGSENIVLSPNDVVSILFWRHFRDIRVRDLRACG